MLKGWVLTSALIVAAGWILSALGQLNRAGYGTVFAAGALWAAWWLSRAGKLRWESFARTARKERRRLRRWAPLLFVLLAVLAFIGGVLYVPQNGDTNAYRIPRVFHWLAEERWHWIRTSDGRMNIASCGFEWLLSPLFLFTRTDRATFLVTFIPFLFMPGLVFSLFRRLAISRRVAWWWMWLLPSGWCFAMQAGSSVNDGLAAVYFLAAIDFALRARQSRRFSDVALSLLAVALMTGVKQTNLPLGLPWLVAILPSLKILFQRWLLTFLVGATSVLVSVIPTAILNIRHVGHWAGVTQDPASVEGYAWANQMDIDSPLWGLVGNAFCFPAQNLLPPYFPFASSWNRAMHQFLETPFGSHFRSFESFGRLGNGVSEATAGIGLGILFIAAVSIWAARRYKAPSWRSAWGRNGWFLRLMWITPWISLLVFLAKIGSYQNARHAAAYYVVLLPILLIAPAQAQVVRNRFWQRSVLAVLVLTACLLVISRARPLFPAATILTALQEKHPNSRALARLWESYEARFTVDAVRAFVPRHVPPEEEVIGALSPMIAEAGFWLPFGQRKVVRILNGDTRADLKAAGIRYIIIDGNLFDLTGDTLDDCLARFDASLIEELTFRKDPGAPPGHLYLVRLNDR